jgi:hypothetical protein
MAYCYFPADNTYARHFRETVSINYSNVVENFGTVLQENKNILSLGALKH